MKRYPWALVCTLMLPCTILAQDFSGELVDLNWVGFQQFQEVSRVFVRTTEPVKYRVDNSRAGMVALILENCRSPLYNNQRPLDTRHFKSPVTYVSTKVIEGPSPSIRIEIRTPDKVPFKTVQSDNFLALDFQRITP